MTGFPNDVKERELNNMLRFMPGYEASQMNWKNGQVSYVIPVAIMPCWSSFAVLVWMSADHVLCVLTVQAQGFALFYTGVAARAACSALGGMR